MTFSRLGRDMPGMAMGESSCKVTDRRDEYESMVSLLHQRCSPIAIDVGSRWVKLLQLSADGRRVWETAVWELPPHEQDADPGAAVAEAINKAREHRRFRGNRAVLCLTARDLFVQNIRIPRLRESEMASSVYAEAETRLPVPMEEAEIRYIHAGEIRQGEAVRNEIILMACSRKAVERLLGIAEVCRLRPVGIDAEPAALIRCYCRQFRRAEDRGQTHIYLNIGAASSMVTIARDGSPVFVKYIQVGGRHFDEAVAEGLSMPLETARSLRRNHGDRRSENRDPVIVRGIHEALRPVMERLMTELSMCVRYHSVTFREHALDRVILGGGEAEEALAEQIGDALQLPCEVGDPFRALENRQRLGKATQWDIAAGLALKTVGDG